MLQEVFWVELWQDCEHMSVTQPISLLQMPTVPDKDSTELPEMLNLPQDFDVFINE